MFEVRNFACDGVVWEFLKHDIDVHETVAATPQEKDWGFDILGWEFGNFIIAIDSAKAQKRLNVIIVHLEGFVADYLKPMDDTFCAGEGVKVGISGKFLVGTDILGCPVEEERERYVDEFDEDGRVEYRLPHCGGAQ